jgi:hypothetical protein
MKRNKKTVVVAKKRLAPLTERILEQMGPEGSTIRKRLENFYRERLKDEASLEHRDS